jgi:hypothetical protein
MATQAFTIWIVLFVLSILATFILCCHYTEVNDFKVRKELFRRGRIVKCLSLNNELPNQYHVDCVFLICKVVNNDIVVQTKNGKKMCKKIFEIGEKSDIIEVYDSNYSLIGKIFT